MTAADTRRPAGAEQILAAVTVGLPTAGAGWATIRALSKRPGAFELAIFSGMYFITAIGVETGMHRYFAHRAFAASPSVEAVLAVSGSMAAQGPITFWVSTHRKHHVYADRNGDPHSPLPRGHGAVGAAKGLWHGHVGWLFASRDQELLKYGKDILGSRRLMFFNRHYLSWIALGLLGPTIAGGLYRRSWEGAIDGLLWGGLVRIFALDHATWSVNSLGHTIGNRMSDTRDNSRNIALLSPPTVGGSWHNNHHARPGLATTSRRWWQLDISGAVINALERSGLVSEVRRPELVEGKENR